MFVLLYNFWCKLVKRILYLSVFVLFGLLKDMMKWFGVLSVRDGFGFSLVNNVLWINIRGFKLDNLNDLMSLVDEWGFFLLFYINYIFENLMKIRFCSLGRRLFLFLVWRKFENDFSLGLFLELNKL